MESSSDLLKNENFNRQSHHDIQKLAVLVTATSVCQKSEVEKSYRVFNNSKIFLLHFLHHRSSFILQSIFYYTNKVRDVQQNISQSPST